MVKYTREEFLSFLNGIRKADEIIRAESPDFYLIGLNGGGPLFDALRLVDRDIQEDSAIYLPTSSKIMNSGEVVTRCWENFFLEKKDESAEPRKILSVDEVVSGHSVERLLNGYNSASRRVARRTMRDCTREEIEREAENLRNLFPLKVVGIREERQLPSRKAYLSNVKNSIISEIPVKKIITMDDPDFHIVNFNHPNSRGWSGQGYFPTIESFNIQTLYLDFLKSIAVEIGVDPASVSIKGVERMREHCEFYSKKPKYT